MSEEQIKDLYPFLPTSVIRLARKNSRQDLRSKNERTDSAKTGDEYAFSSSRSKFGNFDLDIGEFILSYFNREKKRTVDPFAGWGERGLAAKNLAIPYTGLDISKEAISYAKEQYNIDNSLVNSMHMPFESDSFGFSFTCPPYWNLEKYESVEGQLSDYVAYGDFLAALGVVVRETGRVLSTGSLCSWVIADFRWRGEFYDFSADVSNIFKYNSFSVFDKIIIDKSSRYRIPLFMPQAHRLGYTVKLHEYIIVWKNL